MICPGTKVGKSKFKKKINKAMIEPIKTSLQYQAIGRKLLMIESPKEFFKNRQMEDIKNEN